VTANGGVEAANFVQAEEEEETLLMAFEHEDAVAMSAVSAMAPSSQTLGEHVFLNEERARVELRKSANDVDAAWYMDTGASNHMTGDASVFAELSNKVSGSVRFGDGSIVDIHGRGSVMFSTEGGRHRALTNVYWIPRLKTNIVSIGQLDENGCPTHVQDGMMTVRDR
jgi:hypothetical protein